MVMPPAAACSLLCALIGQQWTQLTLNPGRGPPLFAAAYMVSIARRLVPRLDAMYRLTPGIFIGLNWRKVPGFTAKSLFRDMRAEYEEDIKVMAITSQ